MRKYLSTIAMLLALATLWGEDMLYQGKYREFPVAGTLNPAGGTIELTLNPAKPATEFENEWAFVFELIPAQDGEASIRTLLGLCISSGENGYNALLGIARNAAETARVAVAREQVFTRNTPVNVALSWGSAGLVLSINGREVSKSRFGGEIGMMPGSFTVSAGPPFFGSAMRVSARQLKPGELNSDPAAPFTPANGTTLIADLRGNSAKFFAADGWNSTMLLPVWSYDDSLSVAGEPAKLRFSGSNLTDTDQEFTLHLTGQVTDGKPIPKQKETIRIPAGTRSQEFTLALPVDAPGHYTFTLEYAGQSYTFTHARLAQTDSRLKDGRFFNYIGHHLFDLPQVVEKLGIRLSRSDAFHWYIVEPEKGQYDWRWSDEIVERNRKAGIEMLGILGSPPAWAADPTVIPTHKNANMSSRRKPLNVEEWENYVRAVATRYRGKVAAWEIWNEVDWHPPAPAAGFSGTTAEYLELLKAAYRAIRAADPDAKVLISGFGYGTACDTAMPFDLLKMGAAEYCDYYNVHSYRGLNGIPELKRAVELARPGMKFWQSEQMWHTITQPELQARLTAAIQFWFIAENFERYINFGEDFFFSHQTRTPIPALPALAFAQAMLRKCDRYLGTVSTETFDLKHDFRRTDGSVLTVLGRTSTNAVWEFRGDVERIRDLYGREVKFTCKDGVCQTESPEGILYIVSKERLSGIREIAEAANACPNPSFEAISGDVASGGLENALPLQWQLREKQFDPQGRIRISTDASDGRYALEIHSSGAGRVYAFFDARIPGPERYVIGAKFKNTGTTAVAPFFHIFDRNSGYFKSYHVKEIAPGTEFVIRELEVPIPAADGTLVFGVGIDKSGTLAVDEFKLERASSVPLTGYIPLELPKNAPAAAFLGERGAHTGELAAALQGKTQLERVPFLFAKHPILLSEAAWKGGVLPRVSLKAESPAASVVLLLTAAWVPANAEVLARVSFVYRDGSRSAPRELRNKKELRDWFLATDSRGISPAFRFVSPRMLEYGVFLIEATNPEPAKEVAAIELEAVGDALIILAGASLRTP